MLRLNPLLSLGTDLRITSLALFVTACSADASSAFEDGPAGSATDFIQMDERKDVVQVNEQDVYDADVKDDSLRFWNPKPKLLSVAKGMYVMGVFRKKPFVRKVTNVLSLRDKSIYFATTDAAISEVTSRATAKRTVEFDPVGFDKSAMPLVTTAAFSVNCKKCSVQFAPSLDYAFDLVSNGQSTVGLGVRGKFVGDLEVEFRALEAGQSASQEITLASVSQTLVQQIGPVPVWESLSVSFVAGVEGKLSAKGSVLAKLHADKELSSASFLRNGAWSSEKDTKKGQTTYEFPVFETTADANAKVFLKLRLAVSVYSVAQTFLDAEAGGIARMAVCPSPGKLSSSSTFAAVAGAKLILPFMKDPEINTDLVRFENKLEVTARNVPKVACP